MNLSNLRAPFRERMRLVVGLLVAAIVVVTAAPMAASAETAPEAGPLLVDSALTARVAVDLREGAAQASARLQPTPVRITRQSLPVTAAPTTAAPTTTPPTTATPATTAPPVTAPPATAPPVTAPPAAPATPAGIWDRLAACESGGNWSIASGNGFFGGLQFTLSSWHAMGGSGMPNEASRDTQIQMGMRLQAAQGWGAWPGCARRLGLR